MIEFRKRVLEHFRAVQADICRALEELEIERGSDVRFSEHVWQRAGGGGGWSRGLEQGSYLEKGGVNVSEVFGELEPSFAAQLPGDGTQFYAAGISLVLHPRNPYAPTVHANFRHVQRGGTAWFGGGADLTPYYFFPDDRASFHAVWRELCAHHPTVADYDAFSAWCDRYFYLPHRGERRGVGGIFFDHITVPPGDVDKRETVWRFVAEAANSFTAAYLPIARRRADLDYGPRERQWQELRRGRYVEFNLLYDRGTVFGLRTRGRTESILMSLPPCVRWPFEVEPDPASPEGALLSLLRASDPT